VDDECVGVCCVCFCLWLVLVRDVVSLVFVRSDPVASLEAGARGCVLSMGVDVCHHVLWVVFLYDVVSLVFVRPDTVCLRLGWCTGLVLSTFVCRGVVDACPCCCDSGLCPTRSGCLRLGWCAGT
jgi:hypothetical protein